VLGFAALRKEWRNLNELPENLWGADGGHDTSVDLIFPIEKGLTGA